MTDHWAREAQERWGNTDAYRQATERTAAYTEDDWGAQQSEAQDIYQAFLMLMAAGHPPNGDEARATAERHRAHITKWFYDCPPGVHARLAELYVSDRRFADDIDRNGPGLTAYMAAAIAANSVADQD